MKRVRSILALTLALVLVLAMSTAAFAAEANYSITINNASAGHTYEAYQIFAGDLSIDDNGNKVLSNIVWGTGVDTKKAVNGQTLSAVFEGKAAAEIAKSLASEEDAQSFALKVAPYLKDHTDSTAAADGKYVISGLAAGYYLVKDQDNSLSNTDDFYTAYIMQVVANVTAAPKGDKPTLDKQIKNGESWGNANGSQIGDTIEFRTVSTVPDTTGYTTYTYVIHDTMSEGLTSNVNSAADVTIKVNDTDVLDTAYYTVAANGNSFTVTIDILKAVADKKMKAKDQLYTYYSGVLNENAKTYDEGSQNNTAYLEYSNNPNDSENKGKTPEEKVYDWTFKMGINKVNGENKPLTGAKFVLSKSGTLKVADMKCGEDGVPTVTTDLIGLVKVEDGVYRIATTNDASETIVYTIDAGNPVIKGLDDDVIYYLYETLAPVGYNLLAEPVSFKINAEYSEDGSKLADGFPTVTVGNGESSTTLSTDVINNAGSTLPETGGIGTTIFYILGSLLVVGAGIVLVTRKRMNASEN